jgi:hypothetical protein
MSKMDSRQRADQYLEIHGVSKFHISSSKYIMTYNYELWIISE